jgi:hypothetical protein
LLSPVSRLFGAYDRWKISGRWSDCLKSRLHTHYIRAPLLSQLSTIFPGISCHSEIIIIAQRLESERQSIPFSPPDSNWMFFPLTDFVCASGNESLESFSKAKAGIFFKTFKSCFFIYRRVLALKHAYI